MIGVSGMHRGTLASLLCCLHLLCSLRPFGPPGPHDTSLSSSPAAGPPARVEKRASQVPGENHRNVCGQERAAFRGRVNQKQHPFRPPPDSKVPRGGDSPGPERAPRTPQPNRTLQSPALQKLVAPSWSPSAPFHSRAPKPGWQPAAGSGPLHSQPRTPKLSPLLRLQGPPRASRAPRAQRLLPLRSRQRALALRTAPSKQAAPQGAPTLPVLTCKGGWSRGHPEPGGSVGGSAEGGWQQQQQQRGALGTAAAGRLVLPSRGPAQRYK